MKKFTGINPNANRFGPPVTTSRLSYISDLIQVSATGYSVKTFQLCVNDMDPAILSTIMVGQERYTNYYYEYLNYSVRVTSTHTNIADNQLNMCVGISEEDWTTTLATWQDARDGAENPNQTTVKTVYKSVDSIHSNVVFKPAKLLRPKIYENSEIYSGLYNANPVTPIYVNFIWYSDNSGGQVKVDTNIQFELWSTWYIQRGQRDSGPFMTRREQRRKILTLPITPEERSIAEKNSRTWIYSENARPRRQYDWLAGERILENKISQNPVSQQLIRSTSVDRFKKGQGFLSHVLHFVNVVVHRLS